MLDNIAGLDRPSLFGSVRPNLSIRRCGGFSTTKAAKVTGFGNGNSERSIARCSSIRTNTDGRGFRTQSVGSFRQLFHSSRSNSRFACCRTEHVINRIQLGTEMLRDRACPQGGWNAGNGIVFGAALTPHIDTTAIALLALTEDADPAAVQGLDWLRQASIECSSAYSLAWSAIAFLMHQDRGSRSLHRKAPESALFQTPLFPMSKLSASRRSRSRPLKAMRILSKW